MARGCRCGSTVSCQKVRECVEEWAPAAATASLDTPTEITTPNDRAPVVLSYSTSTGGSADVVDDGGGNLRIVQPGLWEVTAMFRFNAGAARAAGVYGEILGADTASWYGASIPTTDAGSRTYSVGVTIVGTVTVAEGSTAIVGVTGNKSTYALNAQITSVTMLLERLAPTSALASPGTVAGQVSADADDNGPAAEIARERAQLTGQH